jgi:3-phytase
VEYDLPKYSFESPGRLLAFQESLEDSLEIIITLNAQSKFENIVLADNETQPVESLDGEDAADDPAIWVNKNDYSKSLILGTNKTGGIYVYDLQGQILQYMKIGRINNVDLRDDFTFNGKNVVLVAGSNRSNNSISLQYIDKETQQLSDTVKNIFSGVDEVYGICLYKSPVDSNFYVFVNGKGGRIEQWMISGNGGIKASRKREFNLPSQPEGMVASDITSQLYMGVEEAGIYYINAEPGIDSDIELIPGSDSLNPNIVYDIEGLALFTYNEHDYLMASIQGNFSYAVFTLGDQPKYHTSFVIAGNTLDGVEETDGLEVSTAPLGNNFPEGLLVVQDGYNFDGDTLLNQNFKYISLGQILKLLK